MRSHLHVAVLLACHNRKKTTIHCLESLYAAKPSNWNLKIYLVDDGSTDGTGDAVEQFDPTIQIIKGDGNWYWAHSMYQAEMAIKEPHDAIMWLNDDTKLDIDSLRKIDFQLALNPDSILIGQFKSSSSDNLTYGGYKKYDRHPFHFKNVLAQDELLPVDTFNGNLVLIPITVSRKIGSIDGEYAHAYADIDFGLRARSVGIKLGVVPGFIGDCDKSDPAIYNNLIQELRALVSTKSSPIKSQIRYLRRHGDHFWPIYLVAPFIRTIFRSKSKD